MFFTEPTTVLFIGVIHAVCEEDRATEKVPPQRLARS
jgi:hypothetical protein